MYPRTLNREKHSYLVLSVILHFILFACIHERVTHLPQFVQKNEIENEFPLITPYKEIAALKPCASQFGIPVIFQEEPTLKDSRDSIADNPVSQPELQDLQNVEESTFQIINSQNQEEQSIQKAENSNTIVAKKEDIQDNNLNSSDIQKNNIHFTTLSQNNQSTQFETQPIPQKEKKISSKEETYSQSKPHTQSAGPIKKQLTFADLAQGFIQTIKNEGQDFFEREGNENIRPDLEEMKLISYKQKIAWFIQNAFRICNSEEPPHPESIVKCYTILVLNDDGGIRNLQLVYSTGVQAFDTYYLNGIKSAAPFPPIPQHIKKPFVFPFTMVYYTRPKNMAALRRPPLLRFSSKQ